MEAAEEEDEEEVRHVKKTLDRNLHIVSDSSKCKSSVGQNY